MSRKTVKPGDIIAVPLEGLGVAVGLALHVSKHFKNGMMIGFYDQLFDSINQVDIANLGGDFIEVPNYTGVQIIRKGDWKIVGHSPELLATAEIPVLRVVNAIYYKDEIVQQLLPWDEAIKYTPLRGQGKLYVEEKLWSHFTKGQVPYVGRNLSATQPDRSIKSNPTSKSICVDIDLSGPGKSGMEAFSLKSSLEDEIEDQGIGEVVGGGTVLDGSAIDLEIELKELSKLQDLIDLLNKAGLEDHFTLRDGE